MSGFILCQEKKANQPYFLDDVRLNIYTIEELCFYLCNNLYLLNHSLMNRELCAWIDNELNMPELSENLMRITESMSLGRFVITILSYVGFCDEDELDEISHTLQSLKDQTEEEQHKKKADNLLKNGKFEHAIWEYERILKMHSAEKLGNDFYGKVYHNMGNAYAKQFLFRDAAKQLKKAYELAGEKETLKEYLCASWMFMEPREFQEFLEQNQEYKPMAETMLNEFQEQERQYRFFQEQKHHGYTSARRRIEEIKEEYRKSLA